eukprot:NODE_49_length_31687_cov_0.791123.p7 type:complete len:627 gc:universal NODE_49_length_31687_cov_0.791123:15432-17312(+)
MSNLDYEIIECSSYSSAYHPNNIKSCNQNGVVTDQGSRWSSNSNNQQQYMILKLKQHCCVNSILFGKFHKVHVCNLKEFKVFVSYNNKQYIQVLHDGLKNDTEPETFSIKNAIKNSDGVTYPVQYLKIAPLLAHGANFNFSIWYLELHGELIADNTVQNYIKYHTDLSLKVILKYLRQQNNFLPIYDALQNHTNISLEHPYLQKLYNLISNGSFEESYTHLNTASMQWFENYLSNTLYSPKWSKLLNCDRNGIDLPSRGGHQMVKGKDGIFLYGGWNGSQDLKDLWFYDSTWHSVEFDKSKDHPSARSCHKMLYNSNDNSLYVFGRYIDQESRSTASLQADFWKFSINNKKWELLSKDTQAENGPGLLFDHQMVLDQVRNQIFVFGGKTVMMSTETVYSGFYKYDVASKSWTEIETEKDSVSMKSRISHSMLLHQKRDCIYIFSGQRFKDYLADMYEYNLSSGTLKELSRDYSKQGGPVCGFTQRATLDEDRDEIYVFSGLVRDKFSSRDCVRNTFWVFNIKHNKWRMIFQNSPSDSLQLPSTPDSELSSPTSPVLNHEFDDEPVPRYAHQLAYDPLTKLHYLFGGNPGSVGNPRERLNDFWGLQLNRPTPEELLSKIRLILKTQQ